MEVEVVLRAVPLLLAAGAVSTAVLAAGVAGSVSGFSAVVNGTGNAAVTGTVVLKETGPNGTSCLSTDGGSVATNTASCTTINAFAADAPLVPGGSGSVTSIQLKNTGTSAAGTLQMAAGGCTQTGTVTGSATDVCSKLTVVATAVRPSGSTQLYSGPLGGLGTYQLGALAAGADTAVRFELSLPASAGNAYQGLVATVPITWTLAV